MQVIKNFGIGKKFLFNTDSTLIEDRRSALGLRICMLRTAGTHDIINLIDKCLTYKIPVEQIDFLTNKHNEFNYSEMKTAAIGFLNGLTIEDIEEVIKNNLSNDCIMSEVNEAIKNKLSNFSEIEEETNIKTNWFDELEK